MRFQTAQVLDLARISKDTLRVWKRSIAPLSKVDGRSQTYTFAEVVAICALSRATQDLGIQISRFTDYAEYVFDILESQVKNSKTELVLRICPEFIDIVRTPERYESDVVAYIRIDPIIRSITDELSEKPEKQLAFPFHQ